MKSTQAVLSISQLHFDPENPRLSKKHLPEKDIILELIEKEDVLTVVESICRLGYFPNEALLVVKRDNKNIVVEGNRRLCALKLIQQPSLAPEVQDKVESYLGGVDKKELENVPTCTINQQDADTIRIKRHTTSPIKKWETSMQASFYRSLVDDGMSIGDLCESHNLKKGEVEKFLKLEQWYEVAKRIPLDADAATIVNDEKRFNLSMLQRIANTEGFNRFMGVEFDKDIALNGTILKEEFTKGYRKILSDIANKEIDTRNLNTASDIRNYLSRFTPSEKPDIEKPGTFKMMSFGVVPTKPPPKFITKRRTRKQGALIPKDLDYNLPGVGARNTFTELQKIPVNTCPNAAAIVFRSFLEKCLYDFFKKQGDLEEVVPNKKHPPLKSLLDYMEKNYEKYGISSSAAGAARMANSAGKKSISSLESLNSIAHNPDYSVNSEKAKDIWENFEALIKEIIKDNKNDS